MYKLMTTILRKGRFRLASLFLSAAILSTVGAVHFGAISALANVAENEGVTVRVTPLAGEDGEECSDEFVTHYLPHFTSSADGVIRMFQANGSGLAAGDLDQDGDLDLVLGSLYGPDSLFWNEGDFVFRKESFGNGNTRAVTLVDVNGDTWLDIVLTRVTGAISYWPNRQGDGFAHEILPGITRLASVLNWADLDRDGDLDLVTGSYDAGLVTDLGTGYVIDGSGGVVLYRNVGDRFVPEVLETESQAMAIALQDINRDGLPDIQVANDFALPDYVWLQTENGWLRAEPFASISHSTMSIDYGDVNNDGLLDLFTTDMMPYDDDVSTLAAWHPIMADMGGEHAMDDPQHMVNVLQIAGTSSEYDERAADWGIDATGWSWSSKFGDFDNDGYLDLYIVNGMIEDRMFGHLPRHELVETNLAFRNVEGRYFVPAPKWALDSRYSGRGSVLADIDADGDLDIAVNNLRGPAQVFENRLCGGDSVEIELTDRLSTNSKAIGARLDLVTNMGTYVRDVRAASGYLSGDPPIAHFGLPTGTVIDRLEITWPDASVSTIGALPSNSHIHVMRGPPQRSSQ